MVRKLLIAFVIGANVALILYVILIERFPEYQPTGYHGVEHIFR